MSIRDAELYQRLFDYAERCVEPTDTVRADVLTGLDHADSEVRDQAREAAASCMNDAMAADLLALLHDKGASDTARAAAAITFGPALELSDEDMSLGDFDLAPLSAERVGEVQLVLRALHEDGAEVELVRRRALEAGVRGMGQWQAPAAESAWATGEPAWQMTALLCAGYLQGFEDTIMAGLRSPDHGVVCEAIYAAVESELGRAGDPILRLAQMDDAGDLRLHAIRAVGRLRPEGAFDALDTLTRDPDADIQAVAQEAMEEMLFAQGLESGLLDDMDRMDD